ncbi:HD-GYP domain-containing protein [Cohnella endophytica]|uniref:HD-GYP domain-containing protein n=1 Tax=Cohnella endophytica TaxID=2419778 RepID=UPI00389954E5
MRHKHEETFRHCVRVAWLGEKLAETLRLDQERSSNLVRGCFIHDLGKLAVPNEVLDSEDRLTKEQWASIKRHPSAGAELLTEIPGMDRTLVETVLHHHERWDGSGYPVGLSGEDIPWTARACSVVDAFDSMLSPRPYRKTKTAEEAMQEIIRNAGTQFDPSLAERFYSLLDVVNTMYLSYADLFKTF